MKSFSAEFFDGRSARKQAATVTVVGDRVVVAAEEGEPHEYALADVRVQPRIKDTPRRVDFPDGAAASTWESAELEAALGAPPSKSLAHRLESNLGVVMFALAGVIVAVGLGYRYGVPWAARVLAEHLPDRIEIQLADVSLKSLDRIVFKPSQLDAQKKAEIGKAFDSLKTLAGADSVVRLEFRDGGKIGANALALPGGVVVVTDQLVEIMPGTDETSAVLAHELGHVQHRHSLRRVMQDSIVALGAMALYGDASAVAGVASTVPTVMVNSGYSREFEREADSYAFDLLKRAGTSPHAFAVAMQALEDSIRKKSAVHACMEAAELREKEGREIGPGELSEAECKNAKPDQSEKISHAGYLTTHPDTAERIRAAEEAAR